MAITYDIKKDPLYKEGIEKGIEKERVQVVLNMKRAGFSTEDIIKATGLTKAQIE